MNKKKQVNGTTARTARVIGSLALRILAAAMCLLLFGSPLWASHEPDLAQQDTTARKEPAQPTVTVSESFTESVMIDIVSDLEAFELELLNIPSIVTMDGLTMGAFAQGKGESPMNLQDLRLMGAYENSQLATDENGSDWDIETVDSEGRVGWYTSLALDASGYPHISYFESTPNYDLKYTYQDVSGWHIETVDSDGIAGLSTSLALDGSGYPHIGYFGNNELKYAYQDASGWHIETVDSEGRVGYYTSLSLDGSGYPHISYFDFTNYDLKYACRNASGWHVETVDSIGQVGWHTSLALDESGHPHISYCGNHNLKYAYRDASGWHIETVDNEGGGHTSLALDREGYPHISYYDYTDCDLKYAYYRLTPYHVYLPIILKE